MDAEFRDAIRWDRIAITGIAVFVFAVMAFVSAQLVIMRRDISDVRNGVTSITTRVDSIDEHGTRALAQHRLEAHDRAK